MKSKEHIYKLKPYLQRLYVKSDKKNWLIKLIENSEFKYICTYIAYGSKDAYEVILKTDPDVFLDYFERKLDIIEILKNDLQGLELVDIERVIIEPDYNRLNIINSIVHPIKTDWEEINLLQETLIKQLSSATNELDARNIGNSCRIILEKISDKVFDPSKHITTEAMDLSEGKFKNRLRVFLQNELNGESNKLLRQLSISAIDTVSKSVDLANTLTHKKEADCLIAEFCVVGTISAIGLINLANKL